MQLPVQDEILACLQFVFPEIEWKLDEIVSFYKAIGIMNLSGRPYAEREKKLFEVVFFADHVVRCVENISRRRDIVLLDCGCGRSYLPFFVNLVLRKKRRTIIYIGVDAEPELVKKSSQTADALGYTNMEFHQSSIIAFEPEKKPNIVCALHACDTATDEAIAKGIRLKARFIVAASCCQRQIVSQIGKAATKVPELKPFVETKIAKEYVGVALTETLRKLALESCGYKVDMFEFVPTRYTPKNIMLRAEKKQAQNPESLKAYSALRDYFNVKPKIQDFLPELL
ncbi:SAM-dependent methyltransferase [Candidatus Bathyarchaeota archaeon]|nr:SAM-dependent methyltransferase [Candidatus Bathyarchaeota archaeon]